MKFLSSWSIRKKLLLLVSVAVLPALGIILSSGIENHNRELVSAKQDILLLTQSLAVQQEQIVIGIKQTLQILALLPEVKRLDAKACNKVFRDIHTHNPIYSSIGATTPDGNVFAASPTFTPGSINLADRKQIKDVIRTRDFSAGEYSKGRVSRLPTINFAYPVLDENGKLVVIVFAGFRLDQYRQFISRANLPKGSVIGISDYKNVTLYRFPESERLPPGTLVPFKNIKDILPDSSEGFRELVGRDNVYRIYVYKRLWLRKNEPPYLGIYVGVPKTIVTSQADIALIRNLILLGLAAFLAMAIAWIFGGIMIVKPLNTLTDKTRRLGDGQAVVLTQLPHTEDELGKLARSFDDMVVALDRADAERRKVEKEREELIVELTDALANIKTLKGLLPICASCKKIRNDKGHWEQMENYIRDRSEADFSHSLCPECVQKLYPGYNTDKKEIK